MKFSSIEHIQQFLVEINKISLIDSVSEGYVPEPTLVEAFIKGRESIVPKMKSFRRSQASKESWRKNRHKYMSGIRGFHKSTEGKRFHRALGRYLSTRITKRGKDDMGYSHEEKFEALKSISSVRTHLYIDTTYYRPLNEQIEFDLFLDEAVLATINEEKRVYSDSYEFNEKDLDVLCRAVDPMVLVQSYCEAIGKPYTQELLESFVSSINNLEDKDMISILTEL